MVSALVRRRCLELGTFAQEHDGVIGQAMRQYGGVPENPLVAAGKLGEVYTRMNVETLVTLHQKDTRIFFLGREVRTKNYVFYRKRSEATNIFVERKEDRRKVGEVDLMMILYENGRRTPVIVETHLAKYKNKECGVSEMLKPARVERKRSLMRLMLNNIHNGQFERPVVVYVVPQEQLRNLAVPESNLCQFVQRGDVVVPFHTTREGWREEVRDMLAIQGRMTDAPKNEYQSQSAG